MPHDGAVTRIPESRSLTILISSKTKLFYYFGTEEAAVKQKSIYPTSYAENAIGHLIRQKQFSLNTAKDSMIVLIKAGKNAAYKNLVDILDEMIINGVKRYSVVDISKDENSFLEENH